MRGVVVLFVLILSFSMTSAYYTCSDGTNASSDVKDIDVGQQKTINGLPLGVAKADLATALNRMVAEIFVDSQTAILTDNESVEITFSDDGKYNVSLLNSTEDMATINVGGTTGTVEEDFLATLGSFSIMLVNAEGYYPGTAEVEVMVGKSHFTLSNTGDLEKIIKFKEKDYGVVLFSASDDNALIEVNKCTNASSTLSWVEEITINENINDSEEINNTNESSGNDTLGDNETEPILNGSINDSNIEGDSVGEVGESNKISVIPNIVYYIVIVIIILIIFILLARFFKSQSSKIPKDAESD